MKIEWNKMSRLKLLVIILFVLILVGVGAYYIGTIHQPANNIKLSGNTTEDTNSNTNPSSSSSTHPSQKPTSGITSNWKTYRNTQYGFSFKYPSTWEIIGDTQNLKEGFKFVADDVVLDSNGPTNIGNFSALTCRVEIALQEKKVAYTDPILSFDEFVKRENPSVGVESPKPVQTSDGLLSGEGYVMSGQYLFPYNSTMAFNIRYIMKNEATNQDITSCAQISKYIALSLHT